MQCPGCGSANRDTARFCAHCATPLPATCSSCGSELGSQARFCDQCGTTVASPAAPRPFTAVTRRVVTVLFADLVGSTSFGQQVDAESAREALAEYHAMARDTIESAGGTVVKFIGDGVMALFGVPEVGEDDAGRAVAAGLALQREFAPVREQVARRHAADLGLRVGINTGELVLADGDTDVVGDAVNIAARLEAACTPGHVLVGEETWRLTRSLVRYEVLGEVSVKGKHEPIATFEVADVEVHVDDEQVTPFVGRADELARLRTAFDSAVEHREVRLTTVIGAPGVGKTRISREFAESLGDAATVAELRCERAGTATFAPIADLLRTVVVIDDTKGAEPVQAALHELVAELDDAERVAELLASFVGATPARSTEEAFLAVRRLVEAVARRHPLVIVVDDIQWAEPLFLDLLEHLAEWVHDAPTCILGLARPELREIRPPLAEEGRSVAVSIGLEGLDADETALLAARLVGAQSLPSELVARLPTSTEGNPLFVRELMRMLVDDGVIIETASGWQLTIDADAVEVPPTIQSLLAARLDRIPVGERRLVELASVVGPEFALGAVAEISEFSAPELRRALDRLGRRELVQSTGMYWGDEPIYRFHHVLIRDAAYRRLLKRARADLHLRVGAWTERTAAHVAGEHEVAIAYHFEQAHEYHHQLDDVDDGIAEVGRRAAELLGTAAERSLERDDLPAASTLAERALARLDDGDPLVPRLLVVAAEALLGLGDVGRGRPVVERLSARVGTDERLAPWARAFDAQLTMLTEPGRLNDAESESDRAAAQLADLGDEAGVAKARLVRAGALARLGRVGDCEAELDRALTAARSAGDRRRVAAVLGAAPVAALWGPSPIPRAGGRCLDVIRLLRITTGSPAVEATSMRCQAVLEALRGRFDTARRMLADSRATVEELGLRQALGETDLFTGIVELLAGDPEAAEAPLRAAYQGLGRLGIGADAGQAAAHLARALLQQGRLDEADELATTSADLAGENPQTAITAGAVRAEILAEQGRHDEAVGVAADAVARAEGTDIIVDHAAASAVLARVAQLAGDQATAERAARTAAALYDQKGATVVATAPTETTSAATPEDLHVSRWNEHGRAEFAVGYAVDDIDAATAELERLDHEGGVDEPWNEADRLARSFVELFTAGARDEWLALLSPDQVTHDRRPVVGVDTAGADGVADAYPRDEHTNEMTSTVETVAGRGDNLALIRWRAVSGSGREWDSFHLTRWTAEGLNDLNVIFPPDQLDEALTELERLHAEGGADVYGPWNESDRLVVSFDNRFVLGRGDDEVPLVAIVTDSDGRVVERTEFAADGEPDARQHLVSSWLESLNPRRQQAARIAQVLGEAWVAPSTYSFDDLLAPGFELLDGRTLGMGTLDRSAFEIALRGREADGTSGPPVPSRVEFVSDDVMVFRANNLGHVPGSGIDWEEVACNVMVMNGDRITRLEMFDEDDWAGAVVRAQELASTVDSSGLPANAVSRVVATAMTAGDVELDVLADDFVREDRRSTVSAEPAGRAQFVDGLRVVRELGASWHETTLAVRGDRWALNRSTADYDGSAVEMLALFEADEGNLVRRIVLFDVDDVDTALTELDELWLATLDPADAETYRVANDVYSAYVELDAERLAPLVADDMVFADRRRLGFGELDRAGFFELFETRRSTRGPGRAWSVTVHRLGGGVLVWSTAERTLVDGAAETASSGVFVSVVVDGRVTRSELFDDDRLDDALSRGEDLARRQS